MTEPSLRERKQQRAREAIVEAAHALFAERGYDAVTVTDIAKRAEVGRTTFFRYFGDKTEVVFADEQPLAEHLLALATRLPPAGDDLAAALAKVRVLVLASCDFLVQDAAGYRRHLELVAAHPELQDRSVRKRQRLASITTDLLRHEGAGDLVAELAPRIGLACNDAGYTLAGTDPAKLRDAVEQAFEALGRPT